MPRFVTVIVALLLFVPRLEAQTMRERIAGLFIFGSCGEPLCLDVDPEFHGRHFIPSTREGQESLIGFLGNAIGLSIGSLPLTAASGGAIYTFEDGMPVKTSVSSGPIFGDRAQTLGQGRLFIGMNATRFGYRSLRGTELDDLTFNFTHENVDPNTPHGDVDAEIDIIEVHADLDVDLLAATFLLTYGLTERLDVSAAVPLIRTSVRGTSAATIVPFNPDLIFHYFETPSGPTLTATAEADGSAFGVGDIALRAKYSLSQTERLGLAVLGDARLPTGDAEDLLGSGNFSVRGVGILSAQVGTIAPHLNAGYVHRSGEFENSAILAAGGFDILLGPWATLAVDVVSEWPVGDPKLVLPEPTVIHLPFQREVPPANIDAMRDDIVYGTVGLKIAGTESLNLVIGSILPFTEGGLQPTAAWTFGLEYNFWPFLRPSS